MAKYVYFNNFKIRNMENKIITDNIENLEIKWHPQIKGVQIIDGKNNFPISWLNQQGYCEYQIYLQYLKGIKVGQTRAMKEGSREHEDLEDKFKETAKPTTFDEAIKTSKEEASLTREMFVISPKYGIRGYIDEIWMTPDEFIIIDDKPGHTAYPSTINQVRAYCLALKDMIPNDTRKIKGALRQRGTDNIFWSEDFDEYVEKSIKYTIERMDSLFKGEKPFIPTKNKNKCKSCRYQSYCEHF